MELRPFIYYTATFISLCAGMFGFFFLLAALPDVKYDDGAWLRVAIGVILTVQVIMFMSALSLGQIRSKR